MHEVPVGASVECRDGSCGESTAVIVNPVTRTVTHIVVEVSGAKDPAERLVPIDRVIESSPKLIRLSCEKGEMVEMQPFVDRRYVLVEHDYSSYQGGEWQAPYATSITGDYVPMEEERIPPGELAVHRGDRVEATDGHVGIVEEFLIDAESGEITHLVLHEDHVWGKRLITVPVAGIESAHGGAVHLKLDREDVRSLPCIPIKRHYASGQTSGEFEMITYVFGAVDSAEETLHYLEEQLSQQADGVKIRNAAVVVRDLDGTGSVRDIGDISVKKSRIFGAVAGGLVGLLAGPVGAVIGAAAGAGVGHVAAKKIDLAFSNEFLEGLEEHLKPGSSALIVVVDRAQIDELSGLVAGAKGMILQQTLTEEMLDHLDEVSSEKDQE